MTALHSNMGSNPTPCSSSKSLPWIKYNPAEWNGRCARLSNSELGLYHRVVELLWAAAPPLALPMNVIRFKLRIQPGSEEDAELIGLVGLVLEAKDDLVYAECLFSAYEDAVGRARKAEAGGRAKAAANRAAE